MRPTRASGLALAACLAIFRSEPAQAAGEPIAIEARPIERFSAGSGERRNGALTFRGGLELTSTTKAFGGISGLRLDAGGERLTAVTDRGHWLQARIVYDGRRPVRLEDARLEPIVGPQGKALPGSRDQDTEALEIAGGTAYVATEGTHRLFAFDLGAKGLDARARALPLPRAVRELRSNAGMEALGVVPADHPAAGAHLVVAEETLDQDGDHRAWLSGGRAGFGSKRPGALSVKRRDGFAVTDLVFLPEGGDLLLLERRYRPPLSLDIRLRRIDGGDLSPGARLDGTVLLEASILADEIDNMEALAVHRAADGATVLTMMSDDNFSPLQRTILLQFELR